MSCGSSRDAPVSTPTGRPGPCAGSTPRRPRRPTPRPCRRCPTAWTATTGMPARPTGTAWPQPATPAGATGATPPTTYTPSPPDQGSPVSDALWALSIVAIFPLLAVGLELILLAFAGPDTPKRANHDRD